ncbi:MAG: hypothetical protein GW938_08430 [Leptospira sp.]|nr:hypothetical protein [Leptospira sp.]NCS93850.1 hypothetical protein [Leptospira sp.]
MKIFKQILFPLMICIIFLFTSSACTIFQKDSTPSMEREALGPNSREFMKIVEQNFVGKWQAQYIDKNSRIISLELNVKPLGENKFNCTLLLPNEPLLEFNTSYQFGKNMLEGDGLIMSPISGGYADVGLKDHPLFQNEESIKFALVPDP